MDRKDDDKNPPGSSRRKKKREHLIDSPHLERKRKKFSIQNVRLDATMSGNPPAEETVTDVASFCSSKSNCGSETDSQALSMDRDSDSTDSDCAMDQPSLLEQLKTILDNYQDAQIILELIQNADDANATEMEIIYVNDTEETTSGQYKQCGCYSEYFRVPALCVNNNAVFKKDDWKYIKSINRSG
ncbi:Sacsin [Mizuhopecten yessoensis]|uniref:Sacsin n=1 Tax=Mizuhopecten yessoensis TaxID=6573 RepID=A0A210QIB2_MIZYE|nr:Sacsin [Mizuhopecten yessoensis]